MTSTVAGIALEPRTIDAGGIETSYLAAGAGEPVVMLHGSGPGVSAMADWQHNIATLSQRFRVLAPDIVGFGAQRRDDVVYSLRTWTDHIWVFLDAHGIEKTAIVGNSLGGRIALQMATDRADRVTKMVLMGAPGVGMTLTDGLAALRAYEPSHDAMRDLLRNYFAVDPAMITDELVAIRYEASIATAPTRRTAPCSSIHATPDPSSVSPSARYAPQLRPHCSYTAGRTR
jgi:2-hydroxymuconate-semialdehyde hydrolase/2-hydroxy-6-oxo-octa-2,4-dienoate hydrolase